jgi:hypothetical protein
MFAARCCSANAARIDHSMLRFLDWSSVLREELGRRSYGVIIFDDRDVGGSTKPSAANLPDSAAITTVLEQGNVARLPYTLRGMVNDAVACSTHSAFHRRPLSAYRSAA